ncbi:MAG: glutamate-5-semialdehyde dehydrogenase [Bacteroidales bacterium]|nr:glutamate-5-semialdehyde dehydrogenase [Bacteroidales bacterium]
MSIKDLAKAAKQASIMLAATATEQKNKALQTIAQELRNRKEEIIAANNLDLERSKKENLAAPLLKRLKFDEEKIDGVIDGINSLIKLPDPVGETLASTELSEGLELYKISCPIGVIGVIFESRPDALVQISTLCLKSGNSTLLKGGSEALETNRILAKIIVDATAKCNIPNGWIQLLETRADVNEMLKEDQYIDLIIPRGSNDFVKYIMENSNIPVLGHADGICHVYIDKDAVIEKAIKVALDSKCQYVAVCNATETILVHEAIANAILPQLKWALETCGVEIYGCAQTQSIISVLPATDESWKTEYLDYKVSVKIVKDCVEAVDHINTYGSGHTESIQTENKDTAVYFLNHVDSGNVFWNCSTRFSDGFRYGFGAEVGISTNKIHARGPVGLDGLLIYKYIAKGDGHTVTDFSEGKRKYSHIKLNKPLRF